MAAPVCTQLVIGPNASLSGRQAWGVMAFMSAVGFGIAGAFAALGFWPIVPFAGLELAALGAALWVVTRRNRYREVIRFGADTVRVEMGMLGRGCAVRIEWPRTWTRAMLERGPGRHDPSRLWLGCYGQTVEIGRCLTDEERSRLAARIRELLKPAPEVAPGIAGGEQGPAHES